MREISDAIRYTFCFEPADYSDGYRDVKTATESTRMQDDLQQEPLA